MIFHAFLIKYAEIAIKGKNRYIFEDALVKQMNIALSKVEGEFEVKKEQGRIYVFCPEQYDYDETVEALQHVFGIVGICPVVIYEDQGFEQMAKDVVSYMCPHDELTIIMRRYMMRIAEHFAKESRCLGLITGESIGQVASQTLQSLAATNEVCTLPVYRPVIGFDKQEIVERSWEIGTYETSIQPFEDCCTIFVAKHPVTKPNLNVIHRSETKLEEKIDELMKTALETVEIIEID